MTLIAIGISHRTAPVSLLERAALAPEAAAKLLHDMLGGTDGPAAEAAVLSTCNRIELYAELEPGAGRAGADALTALFARHSGVGEQDLAPYLYRHVEDAAVEHLLSVACGLDSMVVGEGQILGQIKAALALAQDERTAGRLLNDLFQQALRVGKRAHSETAIDRAGQSLVTFGLDRLAAGDPCGHGDPAAWLRGRRALVIGAGSMSSLAATTLARSGVAELVIANRTLERAERLAAALAAPEDGPRARAVPINAISMAAELALADIVVSCTGASGTVLTADAVAAVVRERARRSAGRPCPCPVVEGHTHTSATGPVLAMLDLAMPRDVDAAVHALAGVRLVDIESLAAASADAPMAADVDAVRAIVAEETAAFGAARRAAHITPTVVALRAMAADVVAAELTRLHGRLPGLDDKERAEITRTVRRVVDKLLHAPTVRVKELAGEPGGAYYAAALRQLFDLAGADPGAAAAHPTLNHAHPEQERS
ncbi:glutamyl-tRNA reductase [Streptomyces sp. RFCAC02]|uniref:glutamyl-tRNA reductase n=1 Tax=Streptomyces sp. RFCAC02 TaxID=2499143 RepID=UPI00101F956D|nr:glutamyl-tRNA reductase [Streptomyces sp. RFCAC02]